MIEGIERAKDEADSFSDAEGPARGKIRLPQVNAAKSVSSQISLHRHGGQNKGRRIELPASTDVGIVNPLGDSPNQVGPEVIGSESDVALGCNVDWQPGLRCDNTVHTPAGERLNPWRTPGCRDIVRETATERLPHIEIRITAVRRGRLKYPGHICRRIAGISINRMAPRITHVGNQAMAQVAFILDLESIVIETA